MKLGEAGADQVVRNSNNGSFYRFERLENSGTRCRIYSLELFPNGRLIAKPTPTIVDASLPVDAVGPWAEGMTVDGQSARSRRAYENELVREEVRLIALDLAYLELPVSGKGPLSRGSHANKVKACKRRISVIKLGLGLNDTVPTLAQPTVRSEQSFRVRDLVQLPSGLPGAVMGFKGEMAVIRTKIRGAILEAAVPCAVLRPWECARACTV